MKPLKPSRQKGPSVIVNVAVPKALVRVIDQAALVEHRTRSNFIIVAAVKAAEARMAAEAVAVAVVAGQ